MTWDERAACRTIDPREFDDSGTPVAWAACWRCEVRRACRADAEAAPERTQGVFRAGKAWSLKAPPTQTILEIRRRHDEWAVLWAEGQTPTYIAELYDCHPDTVRRALRLRERATA